MKERERERIESRLKENNIKCDIRQQISKWELKEINEIYKKLAENISILYVLVDILQQSLYEWGSWIADKRFLGET